MIYLDNAAATKISNAALSAYNEYAGGVYFNPSASYAAALAAEDAVSAARVKIAAGLNCKSENVIFTSGGTESNNLAVLGFLRGNRGKIICGGAEHASVYNIFKAVSADFSVSFAPVDSFGAADLDKLPALITPDTLLASFALVNNETGAVNDVAAIADIIKKTAPACVVHTDAVQAYGKIETDVKKLKCSMLSLSAHKIHGAKGAGALYIGEGVKIKPLFYGGGQEKDLRSGTLNVPALAAFGAAAEEINAERIGNAARYAEFKKIILDKIMSGTPAVICNSPDTGAPHIMSVSFKNLPAEVFMSKLEGAGVIVSAGAACSSKKADNRVHTAMGWDKAYGRGTLRISFGAFNTGAEIEDAAEKIARAAKELRAVCK